MEGIVGSGAVDFAKRHWACLLPRKASCHGQGRCGRQGRCIRLARGLWFEGKVGGGLLSRGWIATLTTMVLTIRQWSYPT